MAPVSMKSVFLIGLVMLAHSMYMAFSIRQQLQAWHHGTADAAALPQTGAKAPMPALLVPLAIEVLAAVALTMVGFILRSPLSEARLVDFTKASRYDEQVYTGVPFMTFNHRGTARNRVLGASQESASATSESRKKE